MSSFKEKHTIKKITDEASRLRKKYPDRIPVIVEKLKSSNLPDIDKNKFLVPSDLTVGQFIYVVRKRLKIAPEMALFIFINNTLPPSGATLSTIYKEYKDKTGMLFVEYSSESTFGA